MKFKPTLSTLIAASLLLGCSLPIKPSQDGKPSPLVVSSCPVLTPLSDDSMGALLAKLVEVSNTYRDCREAALAGQPIAKPNYSLKPSLTLN